MTDAQLEAHWLAARQLAQLRNEAHQSDRRIEGTVPRGRYAVLAHRNAARGGDLRGHLVRREDAAVPRLGTLAQLDLDHLHLAAGGLLRELARIEAAQFIAAAEIAAGDFPDQVAAEFAMIRTDAALAGVVCEAAHPRTAVERADGVGAECSEAHRRDVQQ